MAKFDPQSPPEYDTQLDVGLQKDLKKLEEEPYQNLAKQVQAEYSLAWEHQHQKKIEQLVRLRLYNNQIRNKEAVGDTTMFTIHQTILASLYIDQLLSEFGGREEGDDEVAENLNQMAEFDYEEMGKDVTDFDWDWDTLFFGRGLLMNTEYIRDPKNGIFCPAPEVIDPITFLRDPRAVSINGNNRTGKNACRFFGREIRMTKDGMERNNNFFASIDWSDVKFGAGTKSLIEEGHQARTVAQGNQYSKFRGAEENKLGDNAEYNLTEWFTHWKISGTLKKVRVWLANDRKLVVGLETIGDPEKKLWGVVDRPLYPTSHDWDGTSIPDLTEDKQRQRAIAQNLGLRAMTADLYPNYIYDQNKITNRNDLEFGFNKFIPVNGDPTAILPMRKASPNMALLEFIYNTLDMSAQKATATPEIQQGQMSSEKRTLGEMNIVASKVDTRYSLSAKIFGWSEKRFWQQWYMLYKDNFADTIDEKVLRVVGAFGPKWRPLGRDNIIARLDPDIKIDSKLVSRARQLEERQSAIQFVGMVMQDPTSNRRYAYRKVGKLFGWKKDELDRLLPPTIDERQAEDENDLLNEGKFVSVLPEQDHNVHLEIHAKTKPTDSAMVHIETHKHALMVKKNNPALFPTGADQASTSFQQPGASPTPQVPGAAPAAPAPMAPSNNSGGMGMIPTGGGQ
jgi:hypothetical protein